MDKNKSRKLQSIWVGPYQVIAVSGETGNCKLSLPSKLKNSYMVCYGQVEAIPTSGRALSISLD
jgi:hypothetical protein